jgi:hypothetical protein
MRPAALALALALAACAALPPAVDGAESAEARAAPYPALIPVEPLLALAAEPGTTAGDTAAVEARAARLRARAAALHAAPAP